MAKKRIMAKPIIQSVCHHSKWCPVLYGLVFIALGILAGLNLYDLNIIIALALIILGLKKLIMAAKCC